MDAGFLSSKGSEAAPHTGRGVQLTYIYKAGVCKVVGTKGLVMGPGTTPRLVTLSFQTRQGLADQPARHTDTRLMAVCLRLQVRITGLGKQAHRLSQGDEECLGLIFTSEVKPKHFHIHAGTEKL